MMGASSRSPMFSISLKTPFLLMVTAFVFPLCLISYLKPSGETLLAPLLKSKGFLK